MAQDTVALAQVIDLADQVSPSDQPRLIGLLSERLRSTLNEIVEPVDMLSLTGLGSEMWRQIDVDAYLDEERSSWED